MHFSPPFSLVPSGENSDYAATEHPHRHPGGHVQARRTAFRAVAGGWNWCLWCVFRPLCGREFGRSLVGSISRELAEKEARVLSAG